MGHEIGDPMQVVTTFILKYSLFLMLRFCSCHFTVNRTFLMILDAQKTSAQRRFNAPKIIQNLSARSELCPVKEHHVEGILKKWIIVDFAYLQ